MTVRQEVRTEDLVLNKNFTQACNMPLSTDTSECLVYTILLEIRHLLPIQVSVSCMLLSLKYATYYRYKWVSRVYYSPRNTPLSTDRSECLVYATLLEIRHLLPIEVSVSCMLLYLKYAT